MAHKHSVYDTDQHFKIDPTTRSIINQATQKNKLIKGDHNSERFTFEISRLVDGHDMSLVDKIEIHYTNIDSKTREPSEDVYIVDDIQLSPDSDDVVIFSWLVSGNATKYTGTLTFSITFKCLTESTIDYSWGTSTYSGISVGDSLNNAESVVTNHSDVLAELEQRLSEQIVQEVVQEVGTSTNSVMSQKAVTDALDGLAFKGTATGNSILIDDCANGKYPVKVSVRSNNLIPYPYRRNSHITEAASIIGGDDGGFTGSGTPTEAVSVTIYRSDEIINTWVDDITFSLHGEYENISMEVVLYDSTDTIIWSTRLNKEPVTLPKADYPTVSTIALSIKREGNGLTMSGTAYPMVNLGDAALDYHLYVDPSTITVTACGKTYTPNVGGTVDGVISTPAPMSFTTNTDGVTMDVEYYKDINRVISEILTEGITTIEEWDGSFTITGGK